MRVPDVHRSLRRWTGWVLGDATGGWIIRTEQRNSSPDDLSRDIAFVELAVPATNVGARSGGPREIQGDVRRRASFSITLLPKPGATPQEASLRAMTLSEDLLRAAESGIVTTAGGTLAPPMQIPIWDWSSTPIVGTAQQRSNAGLVRMLAEVEDVTSRPIPDPDDDRLYSVVAVLRLGWFVGGRGNGPAPRAVGGINPSISPPFR